MISVIGQGKLGKPIADVFSKYFKVNRFDKGDSLRNLGDMVFVVVPTPSEITGAFSSLEVENVLSQIKHPQRVVIVSTVMPGETDRLQKKYPKLTLLYNPTFVALGSVKEDFTYPDFVLIGGKDKKAINMLQIIHQTIAHNPEFCVMSALEAEIAKLTLNCYITAKITFANQIGNLCERLDIKPDKILNAVGKDSRIGNKYFKAGLSYGGPCFPRDNVAMTWYMYNHGIQPKLQETVHELNKEQIEEMIYRIHKINPKSIGFKSLSYKEGSDITEESHLWYIYEALKAEGYKVKKGKGEVNIDWGGICE